MVVIQLRRRDGLSELHKRRFVSAWERFICLTIPMNKRMKL